MVVYGYGGLQIQENLEISPCSGHQFCLWCPFCAAQVFSKMKQGRMPTKREILDTLSKLESDLDEEQER